MNELALEGKTNIKDKIYEINGKYVMLDSDLARVYHCKNGTKEVNQAVKNNIEKFPERYSWVLSDEESNNLLVKIFDQKIEKRGGRYKNPRVFTEEGCLMLGTILKSDIAINTTIIIDERDVYHCGASFKDLGKKCFGINRIKDEKMIKELLSRL